MYEKYNIMEIRFLPMGKNEFKTVEEAREFLRYQLPKTQDGDYWYQEKGIDSNGDLLVLFRIQGYIIGSGIFKEREKFPEAIMSDGKEYHGINRFYPETIFNIDSINLSEYQSIDKDLKSFTQSIKKTDMKYLNKILSLVHKKWKSYNEY